MAGKYKQNGSRIANRRQVYGWSQQEFAEILGTSQTQVSRWERGDVLPAGTYLQLLSDKLNVDIEYILLQQDEKKRLKSSDLSEDEIYLIDSIRTGDAKNAISLLNRLLRQYSD